MHQSTKEKIKAFLEIQEIFKDCNKWKAFGNKSILFRVFLNEIDFRYKGADYKIYQRLWVKNTRFIYRNYVYKNCSKMHGNSFRSLLKEIGL